MRKRGNAVAVSRNLRKRRLYAKGPSEWLQHINHTLAMHKIVKIRSKLPKFNVQLRGEGPIAWGEN